MPAISTAPVYLPLDFNQLFDLARQLPDDEKRQLAGLLMQEEAAGNIPEEQKQLVLARVKKYELHPELLIEEEQALAIINQL